MAYHQWTTTLFVCFGLICVCQAWVPRFINGRMKGGMLGAPKPPPGFRAPPEQYFQQRLNHFDGRDYRTWKQRYFVNETFYKTGGPIFVMIGGEGTADPVWMVEGTWIKFAEMYNAMAVMLEHRYYGKSHPTADLSVENLQYLSSRQALEDLANFIQFFRKTNNLPDNKLITFGGSYPGSLSAWFRSKYPYMVDGAVATSAPIFAQLDFKEFLGVVTKSLATTGPFCDLEIMNATKTIFDWLSQPDKLADLQTMFKLCDKIDPGNKLDMAGFFSNLAGNVEGVVQYNKDNRAFEGAVGTDITIDTLCNIMKDNSIGPPIARYAAINTLMLKTYSQDCLDFQYSKMIEDMKKTDWSSSASEGGRQWTYQTCAEFGWYQSSDLAGQPFGNMMSFPVNFSCQQCMDIFDQQFTCAGIQQNVEETNKHYGGRSIPVTKVVFPNGSIDPWHAMGVTEDISPEATAVFITGTAHCANMYPELENDLPELKAARETVRKLIGQWIS